MQQRPIKKFLPVILCIVMALSFAVPSAANESEITVTLARRPVMFPDQAPVVADGELLVPIRALFEALSFDVTWNDGWIALSGMDTVITFTIGFDSFNAYGREYSMNVPAQIIGDRALVSVESMLNYLGFTYGWDGSSAFEIALPGSPIGTYEQLYVVRPGDTLSGIAAMFYWDSSDISEGVELIMKANDMNPGNIQVGQVLIIPAKP